MLLVLSTTGYNVTLAPSPPLVLEVIGCREDRLEERTPWPLRKYALLLAGVWTAQEP